LKNITNILTRVTDKNSLAHSFKISENTNILEFESIVIGELLKNRALIYTFEHIFFPANVSFQLLIENDIILGINVTLENNIQKTKKTFLLYSLDFTEEIHNLMNETIPY
jgi:hypothetical protein